MPASLHQAAYDSAMWQVDKSFTSDLYTFHVSLLLRLDPQGGELRTVIKGQFGDIHSTPTVNVIYNVLTRWEILSSGQNAVQAQDCTGKQYVPKDNMNNK